MLVIGVIKRRITYSCLTSFRASEARDVIAPDILDQSLLGRSCCDIESLLKNAYQVHQRKLKKDLNERRIAHSCLASLRACEAREVTAPDHLDQ